MTEREVVKLVDGDPAPVTNFSDPHWVGVDPRVLDSCFDKGFLYWHGKKLAVSPLGRRSCGGGKSERHH